MHGVQGLVRPVLYAIAVTWIVVGFLHSWLLGFVVLCVLVAYDSPRWFLPHGWTTRLVYRAATDLSPAALASTVTTQIVELTNLERAKQNLPGLRTNDLLTCAACLHAAQMAVLNKLAHSLDGSCYPEVDSRLAAAGYKYMAYGENVAWNQRDAASVLSSWMGSAGHRANILSVEFTDIGVSMAKNSKGEPYYTQVFGRSTARR